jgi:hypothetical protein
MKYMICLIPRVLSSTIKYESKTQLRVDSEGEIQALAVKYEVYIQLPLEYELELLLDRSS